MTGHQSLERFSFRCSDAIAGVPDVVRTFTLGEERDGGGDQFAHLIEAAGPRRPQEGFEFGEGLFDRIEVGTVGRQKLDPAPTASIAVRISGCLCTAKLSRTTTSPGRSVGTNTWSTYARKVGVSMGPSNTAVAVTPSTRNPATTVWVCQ